VSMPESNAVQAAIKSVDFTVTSEVMVKTDTAALTDVQLPAAAWAEKTGTVTNSERRISLQKAFLPMPGQAKADWQIISEVGKRMGWPDAFDYASPAQIFREYAALSGKAAAFGRDFDVSGLAGISDEQYAEFEPTQWPKPQNGASKKRFFADGQFYHSDGKAQMLKIVPPAKPDIPVGHFQLNSGRIRDQWHTMTRSGKSARLSQHIAEPFLEIHPEDAIANGIAANDLVQVNAGSNNCILRAKLTKNIQRGMVFAPMHWSSTHAATGRINELFSDTTDKVSGQPALKQTLVTLQRFKPAWHGFAVSTMPMRVDLAYAAIARTTTGWRCELAGTDPAADWETEARRILNLHDGDASLMVDPAKGTARVAIHKGKTLKGLFFAAHQPLNIARDLAISQIGGDYPSQTVLAGIPASDQLDPGAIVCACNNVGCNTIQSKIDDGAKTVFALGKSTAAGTNCGACKPELQAMIDAAPLLFKQG